MAKEDLRNIFKEVIKEKYDNSMKHMFDISVVVSMVYNAEMRGVADTAKAFHGAGLLSEAHYEEVLIYFNKLTEVLMKEESKRDK